MKSILLKIVVKKASEQGQPSCCGLWLSLLMGLELKLLESLLEDN